MSEKKKEEIRLYTTDEMLSPDVTGEMIVENRIAYTKQEYRKIADGYKKLCESMSKVFNYCEETLDKSDAVEKRIAEILAKN